eukprot:6203219-Pleurochrysis_carterae.AAC.3
MRVAVVTRSAQGRRVIGRGCTISRAVCAPRYACERASRACCTLPGKYVRRCLKLLGLFAPTRQQGPRLRFSLLAGCRMAILGNVLEMECEISQGQMLYLPCGWFHEARRPSMLTVSETAET